jgi:hypothetical protein
LDELAKRFGVDLPPTLIELYSASNGMREIIDYANEPFAILPASDVRWLHELDQNMVDLWTTERFHPSDDKYFVYGKDQDPSIRTDYVKRLIALTPVVDGGVECLNPAVRFPDGELEAWDFSVKYLGARRYKSLATLLEEKCASDCWLLDYWSITHEHEKT